MDIQNVKNMLGINTDKHDNYLAEVIPLFVEVAKEECNNTFEDETGEEDLPAGVKLFVAKAVEYNMQPVTLKGRKMGEVSYSYETELPKTITKYLAKYKRVKWS